MFDHFEVEPGGPFEPKCLNGHSMIGAEFQTKDGENNLDQIVLQADGSLKVNSKYPQYPSKLPQNFTLNVYTNCELCDEGSERTDAEGTTWIDDNWNEWNLTIVNGRFAGAERIEIS